MSIFWSNDMVIDGGLIDEDHRQLLEIINRFEATATRGTILSSVEDTLKSLHEYAEVHFRREEELQREIKFPHAASHRREHERLEKILEDVIHEATQLGREERRKTIVDTVDLLRDWLMEHILKSDMEMKPYFDRMKKDGTAISDLPGEQGQEEGWEDHWANTA